MPLKHLLIHLRQYLFIYLVSFFAIHRHNRHNEKHAERYVESFATFLIHWNMNVQSSWNYISL